MDAKVISDNFAVRFPPGLGVDQVGLALDDVRGAAPGQLVALASERAIEELKFADCLPPDLATRVIQARLADVRGVGATLGRITRKIALGEPADRRRLGVLVATVLAVKPGAR